MKDGHEHHASGEFPYGDWTRPPRHDEIDAKFRALTSNVLIGERCDQLLETARALPCLTDLDDLTSLLRLAS